MRSSWGSVALLRLRNFRFLWIGATASTAGVYVGSLLFDWLISSSTAVREAAILLALLGIIEFVPSLTVGMLAGAWADRYDRRRLLLATQLGRVVAFAALAVLVLRAHFDPGLVLTAALATSVLGSIASPTSNALLPSLVGPDQLTAANGLLDSAGTVAGFFGSPLGGALVVLVGVGVGFLTDSVLYGLAALAVGFMAVPRAPARASTSSSGGPASQFSEVRAGWRFLRSQRALFTVALAGMVLNLFSYYNIDIVLYTRYSLHAGAAIFGILLGGSALGTAAGAFFTHRLRVERAPGIWIPLLWGLSGAPLLVLVFVPLAPVAVASLVVQGFLSGIVNVTLASTIQRTVPQEFLGRVFATDGALSYAMIPVGLVFGAALIVDSGVRLAFVVAGAGMLITGLMVLLRRDVRAWARPPARSDESRPSGETPRPQAGPPE
jgi:MFS family permease